MQEKNNFGKSCQESKRSVVHNENVFGKQFFFKCVCEYECMFV